MDDDDDDDDDDKRPGRAVGQFQQNVVFSQGAGLGAVCRSGTARFRWLRAGLALFLLVFLRSRRSWGSISAWSATARHILSTGRLGKRW